MRDHDTINAEIEASAFDLVGWGLLAEGRHWESLGVELSALPEQVRAIAQCVNEAAARGVQPMELVMGLDEGARLTATNAVASTIHTSLIAGERTYRRLQRAGLEKACRHAVDSGDENAIWRTFGALKSFEAGSGQRLIAPNLAEFLDMEIQERGHVLTPVIPEQGLTMLYAPRGLGKTWASLSIAYAVAAGFSVFNWEAEVPRRVLFVDGEMPAATIRSRLASIALGFNGEISDPDRLHILTPDLQGGAMPNIATRAGQAALVGHVEDAEFIVLDNIATLARGLKENDVEAWAPVQEWLLELRRRGKAVLLIHHSGKSGQQRGTSGREDVLDTVIALRKSADHCPEDGARFEVWLEKARGICGEDARPFEARLTLRDGAVTWATRTLEARRDERIATMHADGMKPAEIAQELNVSPATVYRHLQKRRG